MSEQILTQEKHVASAHRETDAQPTYAYLLGVDGGGTGTRVVLTDGKGVELARGQAGPSGLAHGREQAWKKILLALDDAIQRAGIPRPALSDIAVGCGLAGINNPHWAEEFIALNPGFAYLVAETDAYTTLLGAHVGEPGVVIALGTGSVGEVLQADGSRREVGGWGFPIGDEASGAWMGLLAVNYVQRALDGRVAHDALAQELCREVGMTQKAVFAWMAEANQTRYATLAPLVIKFAQEGHTFALSVMHKAGQEVAAMAQALDPQGSLPLALSGGLAAMVAPYVASPWREKIQAPCGDSAQGAMILIKQRLNKK